MLSEEESQDRFEDSDENEDGKVTWQEYLTDTFGISDNNLDEKDEKVLKFLILKIFYFISWNTIKACFEH